MIGLFVSGTGHWLRPRSNVDGLAGHDLHLWWIFHTSKVLTPRTSISFVGWNI